MLLNSHKENGKYWLTVAFIAQRPEIIINCIRQTKSESKIFKVRKV